MAGIQPKYKKVSDIKNTILSPSLNAYYEVQIPVPTFMLGLTGANTPHDYLNLLCTEASLPGNNLITFNVDSDFTGVTEKFPHRKVYDQELVLTFYVNAVGSVNYYPIKFFETYIAYIAGEDRSFLSNGGGIDKPNYHYKMTYPDDDGGYRRDGLYIYKFEKGPVGGLEYEFYRTYPTSIQRMEMSYGDTQVLKCTVTYTYTRYNLKQKFRTERRSAANANVAAVPVVPNPQPVPNFDKRILTGSANDNDDNTVRGELSNRTQGFINGIAVPRI